MWKRTKSKYGAKNISVDEYSFASQLEAALYGQLKLEKQVGLWSELKTQVRVPLGPAKIVYIADFMVVDAKMGQVIYVESKGFETQVWRIKRKLWIAHETHELRIYKGYAKRLVLTETIHPGGAGNQK